MRFRRNFTAIVLAWTYGFAQINQAQTSPSNAAVPGDVQASLNSIRPAPLRGDLSFIASDELEGRDSPSRGLDVAADYIAAQFRRAGLEPGVGDSYFQKASMMVEEPDFSHFELKLSSSGHQFTASPKEATFSLASELNLKDASLFKLDLADEGLMQHLTASQVEGKVVITEIGPKYRGRLRQASQLMRAAKPALVIRVDEKGVTIRGERPRALVDPTEPGAGHGSPRVTLTGEAAARFYAVLPPGAGNATASVHIAAPHRAPAILRNVIGVLHGSDPALRDTCVLLTAHYDHLGVRPDGSGDRIYNGANDDGSGTVSVMEI
ncbi:MAG: M28 family peptidase, partial [Bryobacterales bacterium]|nr:M28 family peptidase [Bryobacterales bacterium]